MSDKAYEKIYLQWEEPGNYDISWCQDRVNDTDVAYIRGDIVAQLRAELGGAISENNQLHAALKEKHHEILSLEHELATLHVTKHEARPDEV